MASANGTQGCGHYCRAKGKCNGCCASQARGIPLPRDLNDKLRAEFEKVRSLPLQLRAAARSSTDHTPPLPYYIDCNS